MSGKMTRRVLISFVGLLSITVFAMMLVTTSCGSGKPKGLILTPNSSALKNFSGSGVNISESFTISGPDWVISWDFNPDPPENGEYVNYFRINLQSPGDGSWLNIVPRVENTSGKANQRVFFDTPGTYQLEIDSAGGDWEVRVYDFGR